MTLARFKTNDASDRAVAAVISAGRAAAARNWIPATSGNFSVRIDSAFIAITRSGGDKGALASEDVLIQALHEPLLPNSSAEAALHIRLYQEEPGIGAVFHVHSPYATVIAQAHRDADHLRLTGWELLKAFAGVATHEAIVDVPIFANDQDIAALAARISQRLGAPLAAGSSRAPGYLLAGHGLYGWGTSAQNAMRHIEAFETLFHQSIILKGYRP